MIKRIKAFVIEVFHSAAVSIRDTLVACWRHKETVAILALAGVGADFIISELPFWIYLPAIFESGAFVTVLAVFLVMGLCKLATMSARRRQIATA